MAEVYMYIYNWQEKKEENQALEDFCHAPNEADRLACSARARKGKPTFFAPGASSVYHPKDAHP